MSQVASPGYQHTHVHERSAEKQQVTGWVGWVAFASIMMMILGAFEAIAGLVGIFKDTWYAVSTNSLIVFSSVHAWGWAHLIIGAIVFLAGVALLSGAVWARVVAVLLATLSAMAYLVSIALYPIWSVIGITIAVLVIYATIVHGGELRRAAYE